MNHDNGLTDEVRTKINGLLQVLIPGVQVFLYGSRARGTYRAGSDIDLALDLLEPISQERLNEARSVLDSIRVPYSISLVDLNSISKDFRDAIEKDLIPWQN